MAIRANESELYNHYVSGNTNSVSGNKGQAATATASASLDEAKMHDMFEGLLRAYEKAKVKLGEMSLTSLVAAKNGSNSLATLLGDNPLWKALNTPNGQPKPPISPPDMKNFFAVIFKYMGENSDIAARVQVAQAVNILAKQEVIDVSSKEGIDSMNSTEAQLAHIQHEQSEADSFWVKFLKIVIPAIMGVILLATAIITVATGGATAGALAGEAAAASAIDGSVGAAGEAGAEALEITSLADGTATDATGATVTTATTAQTSSISRVLSVIWNISYRVALAEGIPAAFESVIPTAIEPYLANKYAGQASDAGAEEQASAVIQSAAITNLESNIQENMAVEQFEQSIQQSSLSLAEQTAAAMTKVYSLG